MATKVKPSRLQITWTPQAWQVPVYVDEDTFQRWAWWGGGSWDVSWPASSTDWDIVLFNWATGKIIKDSWVGLSSKLDASALSNNNYWWAWENDSTHTPTKWALYTKIHTMDVEIWNKAADNTVVKLSWNQTIAWTKTFSTSPVVPSKSTDATNSSTEIATEAQVKLVADDVATINGMISSNASSSNKLMDKNYIDDSINSVTAYYITKNAQGDQWATYSELAAASTFYSWGVARTPTRNDYTIVLADENHDNATTRYIYNSGWEYQYTVNETALTQAQLDAINSGITAWKVSTYDWYASTIAWKQDKLTAWTWIAIDQDTNTISNTQTSAEWWNITWTLSSQTDLNTALGNKQDNLTLPSSPTQWHLVAWWANNKTLVDGWAIPTWLPTWWTEWQILMIVSWTPTWVTPTAKWFKMLSPNSPLSVPYDWYGTEAQYNSATKSNDTEYRTV